MPKTVEVWVLAKWQIPQAMWDSEGEQIMSVMDTDVKFAMAELSSLDCGPVALKTRIQVAGEEAETETSEEPEVFSGYKDPDEYRERTGKRFRMTKEQKDRGLTREAAFNETHNR